MASKEYLERVTKTLVDEGRLIEAGWAGLRLACGLLSAPAQQLREMRMAFFAGAQHSYASLMTVLEPGDEPTETDLKRMELIHNELDRFVNEFEAQARHAKPEVRTEERLGDQPIEPHYREQMNSMAQYLDRFFNGPAVDAPGGRKTGFVLMTFAFGEQGRCNYISNANREDIVILLKEQIRRFEGAPDVTGHA